MLITLAFSDDDWAISAALNMIALVETCPERTMDPSLARTWISSPGNS